MDESNRINPYATPVELSAAPVIELPEIMVDGKLLVVASGVELPRRCIKSNVPLLDRDRIDSKLTWRGKSFRIALVAHECALTLYVRPLYLWSARVGAAFVSFLFLWFLIGVLGSSSASWLRFVFAFVLGLLGGAVFGRQPALRVVDYKNKRFWIQGCGRKFLKSLEHGVADQSQH